MNHLSSYPSVYALGHRAIQGIFDGPVTIEEKVDGSQISFGLIDGELCVRSKGVQLNLDAPEGMFELAVQQILTLDLLPDFTYRGEYLKTPKHNTLAYSRVPNKNIILFDVMRGPEEYCCRSIKEEEARRIGLEIVPCIADDVTVTSLEEFSKYLEMDSILGGCKVEGVVVKNYNRFTADKKVMMGKFVSEGFKEKNSKNWKAENPGRQDVVASIIQSLATDARYAKSVQHLRDSGVLTDTLKDIGPLIVETGNDIHREEAEWIKEQLFAHFWPQIKRAVVGGVPEFYKKHLAQSSFTTPPASPANL